jgi:TRAP-type C4-dicarboxylate transport system permease small subunit
MNSFARALTKFDHILARGEAWVLITLVAVMTGVVFLQVIYRYFLTQPLHWSEEMARYLFVWISLLGAALSVQRRGHFGMDFFFRMLSQKGRRFLIFLIYLLVGIVMLVLLVYGIVLVQKTVAQQSPAMEISMGWAYACLPVGAALMSIHLLAILLQEARKEKGTL